MMNLHVTEVADYLRTHQFVPADGYGPLAEVLDVELRFAKQHFTDEKVSKLPAEVLDLLQSNEMTHYDAQQIYAYLEQSEGGGTAKNIFGIFNSSSLKSWWNLLRSWEKENFHINHAVNHLVKKSGVDVPNVARKLLAAEKALRTIDSRLVELQTASMSYDKAYSDEYKSWKKQQKESSSSSMVSSSRRMDMSGGNYDNDSKTNDPSRMYDELCTLLSSQVFVLSMDYVFSFRKFSNLQTARNDYPRTYRALRALNAIPSSSIIAQKEKENSSQTVSVDEDETLEVLIRNDNFPRDLLLELQGLKAFMKQKRSTIEDSNRKNQLEPSGDGDGSVTVPNSTENTLHMLTEVHGHIEVVDVIITKLKALRIVVQQLSKKHASSITSDCSADQLRLLRERAVKYRMFFDELRQNREDISISMQRYSDELARLRASCQNIKQWLEGELSQLSNAEITIVI